MAGSHEITTLLRAWSRGDGKALETLVPMVERELRVIAKRGLAPQGRDVLLDTTALVHEAYLRLIGSYPASWQDRAHFFAVCARIMRAIRVDYARACRTAKRGGGTPPVSLDEALAVAAGPDPRVLAIDDALQALSRLDPRKGMVVEMRFFGGLNIEETAEALNVSPDTVQRDWRLARAWLLRELGGWEAQ